MRRHVMLLIGMVALGSLLGCASRRDALPTGPIPERAWDSVSIGHSNAFAWMMFGEPLGVREKEGGEEVWDYPEGRSVTFDASHRVKGKSVRRVPDPESARTEGR